MASPPDVLPARSPLALDIPFPAGSLGLTRIVTVRRLRSVFRFYFALLSVLQQPWCRFLFLEPSFVPSSWLLRQQAGVCIVSLTIFFVLFLLSCRATPVNPRSWPRFEHHQSCLRYPVIACCGPSTFTIANSFRSIQRSFACLCDDTSSRPDTSPTSSFLGQFLLPFPERIARDHPQDGAQQPRGHFRFYAVEREPDIVQQSWSRTSGHCGRRTRGAALVRF